MKKNLLLLVTLVLFKTVSSQVWSNGQNASYALGAVSPSAAGSSGPTVNTFGPGVVNICFAIDAKHGCLYVADFFSNRVLRFAYPITSNQPSANLVFGQSNFTNLNSGGLTQNGLEFPQGLAVDSTSGTLWILSQAQNRILRFDGAHTLTVNNPNANAVIGQVNFTSGAGALTASGLSFNVAPQCANLLHYDQLTGALWVVDNGNIRVLKFNNAKSLPNGPMASLVLGQTAFTTNNSGVSQSTYTRPDGIVMIGSSLFVSDPLNNRVLRYDNANSLSNGALASAVYGQINFSSTAAATSATGLDRPTGLAGDQNNLYVCDLNNKRVLIYNNPLTNTTANTVLLSHNLTTVGSAATTPSTGGFNTGIVYDSKYEQLIVQDRTNNRALVFQPCGNGVNITGPDSVCNGSSIVLTASGALSYSWSTSATSPSISVSPSVTTAYSFTGTSNFCSLSITKTVVVNPLPTVSVSSSASLICAGNSVSITASGASTYSWNTISTNTTIVVTPTTNTSYTVTGTDLYECNSLPVVSNVSVQALPILTITSSSSPICSGESVTLIVSGANTYTWNAGSTSSSISTSPLINTTYSIIATGTNGCSNTATFLQIVDACTNISSIKTSGISDGTVYPNPTSGSFTIDLTKDSEILICSITGQHVLKTKLNSGIHFVEFSEYDNGIYFIVIKQDNQIKTIKFIKH